VFDGDVHGGSLIENGGGNGENGPGLTSRSELSNQHNSAAA